MLKIGLTMVSEMDYKLLQLGAAFEPRINKDTSAIAGPKIRPHKLFAAKEGLLYAANWSAMTI